MFQSIYLSSIQYLEPSTQNYVKIKSTPQSIRKPASLASTIPAKPSKKTLQITTYQLWLHHHRRHYHYLIPCNHRDPFPSCNSIHCQSCVWQYHKLSPLQRNVEKEAAARAGMGRAVIVRKSCHPLDSGGKELRRSLRKSLVWRAWTMRLCAGFVTVILVWNYEGRSVYVGV